METPNMERPSQFPLQAAGAGLKVVTKINSMFPRQRRDSVMIKSSVKALEMSQNTLDYVSRGNSNVNLNVNTDQLVE